MAAGQLASMLRRQGRSEEAERLRRFVGLNPDGSIASENAQQAGQAERVAGVAQAVWPLAVVFSCCRPVRAALG